MDAVASSTLERRFLFWLMDISASSEIPVFTRALSTQRQTRVALVAPLLLVLAIFMLYLGTIGTLPLLGKDEPRYIEVAREMFTRGDWVTPTLGGQTWFEKPALLYWLVMASFHLFGVSEWAARLGPALCGLATIGLVSWMARRVEQNSRDEAHGLALWSGAATASSVGLIAFSHAATFDIVLTATITLALACFFVAELEEQPQKRRRLLAGMWAGIGLSLLAKGLVGIILPGGVILLYFALRRDWRGIARLKVLWGLPLALAVAALWYGPVIAQHGQAFINEFFIQHHFARYTSNKYRHAQPVYYYLPIIALFALPWTAFLFASLREIKFSMWREEDAQSQLRVFALAWLVVPVAFFSLSGSKLAGYVLPALPGAIVLAGLSVAAYVRGESGVGRARITGVLLLLLGIGMALYARRSGAMETLGIAAVAVPLIGAGVVVLAVAQRRALCAALVVGAMLFSTSVLTGISGVLLAEKTSVRALLREAKARGYDREAVWQMDTTQRTAEFYAAGRLLYNPDGEPKVWPDAREVARHLPSGDTVLLLLPAHRVKELAAALQIEQLGDNGDVALVRVHHATDSTAR